MTTARLNTTHLLKVSLVSAAIGVLVLSCGCQRSSVREVQAQAVREIQGGSLAPDSRGMVILPAARQDASVDGRAYVLRKPDGTLCILFAEWRGKGSNLRGQLFWSPAPALVPQFTEINGPRIPMNQTEGYSGLVEVKVRQQISPNWYEVDYDEG
jgi:hypothetical protein